jgi:uncharacterized protein YndB with AHSA1/START domain
MPGLTIDRDILIEAPVEVVWRTITEPEQISQWFADRVDLVIEPGAHGYMAFGDQGGPVVVEVVDRPVRFSFRWNHPRGEEPVAGNWPDAEKQRYADEHSEGWVEYLERLVTLLAKRQLG